MLPNETNIIRKCTSTPYRIKNSLTETALETSLTTKLENLKDSRTAKKVCRPTTPSEKSPLTGS